MKRISLEVLCLVLAALPQAGFAQSQVFELPRINGTLLDWCYNWGAECGKPAADRFCVLNDYAEAVDFGEKPGPLGEPTMLISDGRLCEADDCGTFEYIACEGNPGTVTPPEPAVTTRFEAPAFNGIRLDWCYEFAAQCGEASADRFCSSQGFAGASAWQIEENVGHSITLATGKECVDGTCDGFTYIDCTK